MRILAAGLILAIGAAPSMFCAADSAPLPVLLDRTGRSVELFWRQFSAVTCAEQVLQAKLGNQGKTIYQKDSLFDYLIFLDLDGNDLSVEESRLAQKQSGKTKDLPLLVTSGFSTLVLVFHPLYQSSFEYRLLDEELMNGQRLMRVAFQHVPGTRSTSALRVRGRDYPLDMQGTAWIDPDSYVIVRITAGLTAPVEDLNLRSLNSEVRYSPVRFESQPETYWLPTTATIDVETARQHWRNVHRFTNYRRFSVKAESSVPR